MRVSGFKALRPTTERAGDVASVPYDTINTAEARALAQGKPDSFLHVIRAEIDLPEGTDTHSDAVYEGARKALDAFCERDVLVRESEPCVYAYEQQAGAHTQCGIVACCHVDDYDTNVILKHERTRTDKEDDRTRLVSTLSAHTGPVFLTYRDDGELTAWMDAQREQAPLFDVRAEDGVRHRVWRSTEPAVVEAAFARVPVSYIADGHHRSAAAARVGRERRAANPAHTGNEAYNWFLAVLFPASQLAIQSYNRYVHDLNGRSPAAFLEALRERIVVTPGADPQPAAARHVSMYLDGEWWGLEFPACDDPVKGLDVSLLQDHVLMPLLGIDDPRTSTRISFVGGIRGTGELERLVDEAKEGVAFSMFPTTVDQMMNIADADAIMPPKSTWFEPKLRSGLLISTFEE